MKINRAALVLHLQKVSCGGQIPAAVFTDGLATAALTEDHQLCVVAPSMEKVASLDGSVGIHDLGLLIKSLGTLSGAGNDATMVNLSVDDNRLVINEEHRGTLRLMTANPSTIGSRLEKSNLDQMLKAAPSTHGVPLTRALVEGIDKTFSLLKAQELQLVVGKKKGLVRIGNENAHMAEFELEGLKTKRGEDEYTLLFASHLVDVLKVVSNFSEAQMFLGGASDMIVVQDGAYRFLLSPRVRPAE